MRPSWRTLMPPWSPYQCAGSSYSEEVQSPSQSACLQGWKSSRRGQGSQEGAWPQKAGQGVRRRAAYGFLRKRSYASAGSELIFAEDFLFPADAVRFTEPAIFGVLVETSAFCARCSRAWSMSTSAIMASAIGVALMPTQGSCRPLVSTVTGLPCLSIDRRGTRILEVGLIPIVTTISCPVEIPPRIPPACLVTNPSGVNSSPCSDPRCVTELNPEPISTAFTALMLIIAPAKSASSFA